MDELKEVKSPDHYTCGGIECKDAIKAMMHDTKLSGPADFWWGCAFKYLWRWPRKNGIVDLQKCKQCIEYLIDELNSKDSNTRFTYGSARDL